METYDDRPISMYDNLNMSGSMHTSTPAKQKPQTTRSPYSEITFQFDDNHKLQQQQQQQQQLLPNGNNNFNPNQPQQQQLKPPQLQQQVQQSKQVHLNTPHYATPFKPISSFNSTTTMPVSATKTPLTPLHLTHTTPSSTTAALATTTTTTTPTLNAFSTQRPLSQHSQLELNESIQSIAAVKAALNDAKSKFFGLNGFSQDNHNNNYNNNNTNIPITTKTSAKFNEIPETERHQVQIVVDNYLPTATAAPLPPKPQPKYQNIPENSAIFRNQPPELPPKPLHLNAPQYTVTSATASSSPLPNNSATGTNSPNTTTPSPSSTTAITTTPTNMATMSPISCDYNGASTSSSKLLPHATNKQLPLNDIDIGSSQPSQAVYMSTTVPQNIKGSKIAGRHTPTRNSLRHSRMLVVNNKNYQAGPDYPNPLNLKSPNLARWLLILQIVIGLLLLCVAIWTFFLAPTTAIQDNPYWSGLSLLVAGTVGLIIIRYQRIKRHKLRENCFKFLRADSYVLSLLAVLLCGIAVACAALHFCRLTASDTKCQPTNILLEHGSCTCTFNAVMNTDSSNGTASNATNDFLEEETIDFVDQSYKFEYRDLSCQEVTGEWINLLEVSLVLNALGFLVAFLYIVLLLCYRFDSNRYYSTVQTSTF